MLSRVRIALALCVVINVAPAATYFGAATRHGAHPPWSENGRMAHEQMVAKARTGKIDLYFLGDSITRRWGAIDYPEFLAHWMKTFFGWNAANFGWGGDSTHHMLWRIQNGALDGVNPKVILILAGTNNIGRGEKIGRGEDAAEGVAALVETCRAKAPAATIVLVAIFPRNDSPASNAQIDVANRRIAALADSKTIRFLDLNDRLADADGKLFEGVTVDQLHLSLKGYEIFAQALTPLLTELLGPRADEDHAPPPSGDTKAAVR